MNDSLFRKLIKLGFRRHEPNLTLELANSEVYKPDGWYWWEFMQYNAN